MTRHEQVFAELLRDIHSGKYPAGEKMPSEAVLGKRFKTSRITVSRALRELKQRGLVEGVAGSGNFVRTGARSGEALRFGLLVPNLGETEIFEPICQGMASAPESGRFVLLWGRTVEGASLEAQAFSLRDQYIAQTVDGVFFAPLEGTPDSLAVNLQISGAIERAGIPLVLLDRCVLPFPQRSRFDLVGIDNRRAGYLATDHLLELGCRKIAFIAGASSAPTVAARIAGCREALLCYGLYEEGVQIVRSLRISSEQVRAGGAEAYVCANDRIAGELMQTLHEMGLRVPDDVRVVGMDDVEYARLLTVPLTTVHQPCREIGQAAIAAMLSRRERPGMIARDILLDCRLVIRASSGSRPAASA